MRPGQPRRFPLMGFVTRFNQLDGTTLEYPGGTVNGLAMQSMTEFLVDNSMPLAKTCHHLVTIIQHFQSNFPLRVYPDLLATVRTFPQLQL